MTTSNRQQNGNSGFSETNNERLASGLGWFSIGLGLAEVVAPGKLARLIGVKDKGGTRTLMRAYGVREIAAGVGILMQPQPAGWLWGRVAGDLVDLASLAAALSGDDTKKTRAAAATAAVLGVTALDVLCGQQLSRETTPRGAARDGRVRVRKSIVINRSPDQVYEFWRNLANLPRFMNYLESVEIIDDRHSHWRLKAPAALALEWDAETVTDQPGSLIAWRSVEGSSIGNSGAVRFDSAPGGRGTLLKIEMQYDPPGGPIGAAIAKLFGGDPGLVIENDLRRLKQMIETGGIARSEASIHRRMHAAQPPSPEELRGKEPARTESPGALQPSMA